MSADIGERLLRWKSGPVLGDYPGYFLVPARDIDEAAAEIVRLRGEVCSCPSGDGSLRWPCRAHPPEAIAPAEAKGDACNCPGGAKPDPASHAPNCPVRTLPCRTLVNPFDTPQPADGGAVAWRFRVDDDPSRNSFWTEWSTSDDFREMMTRRGYAVAEYAHPPAAQRDTGISAAVDRGDLRNTFDPPAAQVQQEGEAAELAKQLNERVDSVVVAGATGNESILLAEVNKLLGCARMVAVALPNQAAHPSACELGAVRDAITETVLKYADNNEIPPGLFRDEMFAAVTAALQHRGDSRGGEGV